MPPGGFVPGVDGAVEFGSVEGGGVVVSLDMAEPSALSGWFTPFVGVVVVVVGATGGTGSLFADRSTVVAMSGGSASSTMVLGTIFPTVTGGFRWAVI